MLQPLWSRRAFAPQSHGPRAARLHLERPLSQRLIFLRSGTERSRCR